MPEQNNTTSPAPYIINCHAHCFTIYHVPEYFPKKLFFLYWLLPISWIIKNRFVRKAVKALNYKWLRKILFLKEETVQRISLFAEYFDERINSQEKVIKYLQSFYPAKTRFVLLTMDMEYMGAGKPQKKFEEQLKELEDLKKQPQYSNIIYPFVFADPRRPNVTNLIVNKLMEGNFTGIKIYPALGYFPFDIRLREIYIYACEHQVPIMTHCIKGVVYFRGSKTEAFNGETIHPLKRINQPLVGDKAEEYTVNFTHPLNFECLLNHTILKELWGQDAPDLSKLKICLGHYGGDNEWMKYLTDPWLPSSYTDGKWQPLDVTHPWFDEEKKGKLDTRAYSWFSICNELMFKYPNVYADISYIVSNPDIYPMLKMVLTMPYYARIKHKILFGTDYFVVAKEGSDRELSIKLRAFLGEQLYEQIAFTNPKAFLAITP